MKKFNFLLAWIAILYSCSQQTAPLLPVQPIILDGVYSFDFGQIPTDLRLTGNWTVPRKALLAVSSRVAEFPRAGLTFYSPAVQPVVIKIEVDSDDEFDILINGLPYRISPQNSRIVVRKENILPGENVLTLLPKREQKIYVKKINIQPLGFPIKKKQKYPRRFSSLPPFASI